MNRRTFVVGAGAAALAGCQYQPQPNPSLTTVRRPIAPPEILAMYGPRPEERFPIPAVPLRQVKSQFWRREVDNITGEPDGTVVVDTGSYYLYWTMPGGRAMRYGVGLGREGFEWNGAARIPFKRKWPTWTPPAEMIAREPELERYREGMEPSLKNPLGARALYLFQGRVDTLYRLHGTQEAYSIGRAVSSGCVRLLNQDVIDLYNRVPNGTRVVVRPPSAPRLV
ncbi:MAG: L,D-transpeptidase [Pseudomonadota bacterium]